MADAVGFFDAAHLSPQFRAARSMTPGDYRRQFRKEA
ncbi:hypothetical protein [Rhizobium sp. S9]|nr:hypothetical protein [Rhizobium sp. S9]